MTNTSSWARFCGAAFTATCVGLGAPSARAEGSVASGSVPQKDVVPESRPQATWYGWQTLISDGVSVALIATSVGLWLGGDPQVQPARGVHVIEPLAVTGAILYELGVPAIHVAHGRWQTGLTSLGFRSLSSVVFFLGLGLVAWGQPCSGFMCNNPNGSSGLIGFGAVLAVLGLVIPPIIDATTLAYERAPAKRTAHVTPSLIPIKGGAALGMMGAF